MRLICEVFRTIRIHCVCRECLCEVMESRNSIILCGTLWARLQRVTACIKDNSSTVFIHSVSHSPGYFIHSTFFSEFQFHIAPTANIYLIVLPVRIRIHWGMERFCFNFFANLRLILNVLWAACNENTIFVELNPFGWRMIEIKLNFYGAPNFYEPLWQLVLHRKRKYQVLLLPGGSCSNHGTRYFDMTGRIGFRDVVDLVGRANVDITVFIRRFKFFILILFRIKYFLFVQIACKTFSAQKFSYEIKN